MNSYSLNDGLATWLEFMLDKVPGAPIAHHSLNRPTQSGFAAFFHEGIGGVRPASPGFKRITLKPQGYTQLTSACAEHECLYGLIRSDWKCDGKTINWEVQVPVNTSDTVRVPAKSATSVLESNKSANEAEGVRFLHMEGDRALFAVESETFGFHSNL